MKTFQDYSREKKRVWLESEGGRKQNVPPESTGWTVSEPEQYPDWAYEYVQTFSYGTIHINAWFTSRETLVMLHLACCGTALKSDSGTEELICNQCHRVIPLTRADAEFTFSTRTGMEQAHLELLEAWISLTESNTLRATIAVTDFCTHLSEGQELVS